MSQSDNGVDVDGLGKSFGSVHALRDMPGVETRVAVTAQHRDLLEELPVGVDELRCRRVERLQAGPVAGAAHEVG